MLRLSPFSIGLVEKRARARFACFSMRITNKVQQLDLHFFPITVVEKSAIASFAFFQLMSQKKSATGVFAFFFQSGALKKRQQLDLHFFQPGSLKSVAYVLNEQRGRGEGGGQIVDVLPAALACTVDRHNCGQKDNGQTGMPCVDRANRLMHNGTVHITDNPVYSTAQQPDLHVFDSGN